MSEGKDHVVANRGYWDGMADDWVAAGERNWARAEPVWGMWGIEDEAVTLLPVSMRGLTAIELGCGTGYVSAWMIQRGAAAFGIDNSRRQLATAARLAREHGLPLTLVQGDAEALPFPDASFDFAVSEYGAAIWCDPLVWIPEAHRVLRPGGTLNFLGSHPLTIVTTPPNGDVSDQRLHSPWFGMHRQDWRQVEIDPGGVEFNLPFSEWLRLFRETGFELVDYLELQAPVRAEGVPFSVAADWARRWPSEQVWKLRKV